MVKLNKKNHAIVIVQARMGSSRLPGKMMMELGGHPLLFWVLHRVKQANLIKSIILATTVNKIDDPMVDLAQQLGIHVFRGSEEDVLDRFISAAKSVGAEKVVRVCGDNPLVAPEEIDRLVKTYSEILKKGEHLEKLYAFNFGPKMNNGYPDGLGGEMFSFKLLQRLDSLVTSSSYREHISNYIWSYPKKFSIHSVKTPKEIAFPNIKLDIDTREDKEKLDILCEHLNPDSSAKEVISVYRRLFMSAS